MTSVSTDILIVGAGPCGLMLANELGRRGVSTLVIDEESSVAMAPQANATQARSMEHYRRHGFADEIRKVGLPGDHPTDVAYLTTYAGYELARHSMPSSSQAGEFIRENSHIWNGPELPHRVPQSLVEHTLWQKAIAYDSVTVQFDTAFEKFEKTADGVDVQVRDAQSGSAIKIKAKYLFGADGSQSLVRKQLGIRYGGGDPAKRDFMGGRMLSVYVNAPAFYTELSVAPAWMYWTFNTHRRALLATVDGKGAFVLQTQLRPGEDEGDVSDEMAGELFLQAIGREIPFEVTGKASWIAGRALVAGSFGKGRVWLGGDAVHLFTPTGGMGYNTAIEDAVNMGWKFAAVVQGLAPEALLETYETERRPVALRNTKFALAFADSVGLYKPSPAIEEDSPAGCAARKRAGAYLQQHAAREFTIPGFTLGARYDGSPVIAADDAPLPPDSPSVYVPSGKPGGRAPHVWMQDGTSLFDCLNFEWTVLAFDATTLSAAETLQSAGKARGLDIQVLDLSSEPEAHDFYEQPLALIRPDQILAWRGTIAGTNEAEEVFDTVTGRRLGG